MTLRSFIEILRQITHKTSSFSACIILLFLPFLINQPLIAQCNTGLNELVIAINEDSNFLDDNTRWKLEENGATYETGTSGTTLCVPNGSCFVLYLYDDFGNGLNNTPPGDYEVYFNGVLINSGIDFGKAKAIQIGDCPAGIACNYPIMVNSLGTFQAPYPDTWYRYTPTQSGQYSINTCNLGNTCNTTIWGYDYCDGIVTEETQEGAVFFADNGCGNNQANVFTYLTANKEYFIRIGDNGTNCAGNTINWKLSYLGPVTGCTDVTTCNFNPLAAIDNGLCLPPGHPNCPDGPDLTVDQPTLLEDLHIQTLNNNDDCYISEGCLKGYGLREVLRFSTQIKNIGTQDFYVGQTPANPSQANEQWEWDECHNHWHYEGYAEYLLYDEDGQQLPIGFKNGFCILDLQCESGIMPKYNCNNQGITAQCSDIYEHNIDCQWVDVSDVPEGNYTLVVRVNWDQTLDALGREEVSYDNNWAQACFFLDRSSNTPTITIESESNCPTYMDCLGETFGDAQEDCEGDCGGSSMAGDLDGNEIYDTDDIQLYIDAILNESLSVGSCNELSNDNQLSILDPALLLDCINHEHDNSSIHSHLDICNFPYITIENPFQSAIFSIGNHNISNNFFDIFVQNPSAHISSYNLEFSGVNISAVESIVYTNYNVDVQHDSDEEVVGLSLDNTFTMRYTSPTPFLRVYYTGSAANACIDQIITVLNQNNEVVEGIIGSPSCLNESSDPDTGVTPCSNNLVTLIIEPDNYGSETSWVVKNANNNAILYSGGPYSNSNMNTIVVDMCLPNGCYLFDIFDSGGDGICCSYGIGSYELTNQGQTLESGGNFNSSETTAFCLINATASPGINFRAKAYLQGALQNSPDPNLMRHELNIENLIPLTEPYSSYPSYNHVIGGAETTTNAILSATGNDAIVDWLFLEVRNALDPTQIESTRAVLLQRDGDIVTHNGSTTIDFPHLTDTYYYISIRHRNHLGAMTATQMFFDGSPMMVDFTNPNTATWGNNAQVVMPNNKMALWGGNTDMNNTIIFQGTGNDPGVTFFEVLTNQPGVGFPLPNYIYEGYSPADIDMNALSIFQGSGNDPNAIFFNVATHPNNQSSLGNFIITEQLP